MQVMSISLVSDSGITVKNGKASLVLGRLAQVVERNTMMEDSFVTNN
jgi:hypothetical protein